MLVEKFFLKKNLQVSSLGALFLLTLYMKTPHFKPSS